MTFIEIKKIINFLRTLPESYISTQAIRSDASNYYAELKDYFLSEREKAEAEGYDVKAVLGTYMWKKYFTKSGIFRIPTEDQYRKLQSTGFFSRPYSEIRKAYDAERKPTYHPEMEQGTPYKRKSHFKNKGYYGVEAVPESVNEGGSRYPRQTLYFGFAPGERTLHPSQKPVALLSYLIRTYTNPGDSVLDFCMGSGSTGVACQETGRGFIGIEQNPEFFNIAKSRCSL